MEGIPNNCIKNATDELWLVINSDSQTKANETHMSNMVEIIDCICNCIQIHPKKYICICNF